MAATVAAPTQSATTSGAARSATVSLLARNGSGQAGTALLTAVQRRTLVRIRLGRPVKYPGRQVSLVRPVRCAAYVRKVGDDFAYVPQTATVGLAVSGRSYLIGARLVTLTDGRHSIEVSTMPPQPERVVACGDIPRS